MTYFPPEGWVAFSAIAAMGILAFLNVLARMSESSRAMTRLRIEAAELRRGYAERLAALRARESGAVVQVDADPDGDTIQRALKMAA
jgi:hypothetical protein